ncbi:hypothetical protein [Niabella soli]|uniref:Uncharacterized protein n=1 Tax=Niabella soli DSM 19437 TaxID=929713 RepID=W0F6B2_9BACT|nr:hypothetical protein [Niabella soli]AHF17343.1 hypothetical protein NIASO_05890 [Niabella soli DSM 19437]
MLQKRKLKIKFLGMEFESTYSERTTILILAMVLSFFLALAIVLRNSNTQTIDTLKSDKLHPLKITERMHHET